MLLHFHTDTIFFCLRLLDTGSVENRPILMAVRALARISYHVQSVQRGHETAMAFLKCVSFLPKT